MVNLLAKVVDNNGTHTVQVGLIRNSMVSLIRDEVTSFTIIKDGKDESWCNRCHWAQPAQPVMSEMALSSLAQVGSIITTVRTLLKLAWIEHNASSIQMK